MNHQISDDGIWEGDILALSAPLGCSGSCSISSVLSQQGLLHHASDRLQRRDADMWVKLAGPVRRYQQHSRWMFAQVDGCIYC